jgi:4-hydroxybenzoate polyprenyltransferase
VYLLNDLLDLGSDRQHRLKKTRSFAAGASPLWAGFIAAPLLAAASLAVAWLVNAEFVLYVVGYFAASLAYAIFLKRLPMIDVLMLAGLYTLRVMAGGSATSVVISPWLLGFSMFVFLSLALVKRYSELEALAGETQPAGRGYSTADLSQLSAFGTSSGYIAVMVFALYINSADVRLLYSRPLLLWAVCPLLIYWISRVWLLAHRGQLHEDPVQFALTDKASYVIAALLGMIMLAAL